MTRPATGRYARCLPGGRPAATAAIRLSPATAPALIAFAGVLTGLVWNGWLQRRVDKKRDQSETAASEREGGDDPPAANVEADKGTQT